MRQLRQKRRGHSSADKSEPVSEWFRQESRRGVIPSDRFRLDLLKFGTLDHLLSDLEFRAIDRERMGSTFSSDGSTWSRYQRLDKKIRAPREAIKDHFAAQSATKPASAPRKITSAS